MHPADVATGSVPRWTISAPRLHPWKYYERDPAARCVRVNLECAISEYVDHAVADETDDRVTVRVWIVKRGTKLALTSRRTDVELREPLGTRLVFDGATGGRRHQAPAEA